MSYIKIFTNWMLVLALSVFLTACEGMDLTKTAKFMEDLSNALVAQKSDHSSTPSSSSSSSSDAGSSGKANCNWFSALSAVQITKNSRGNRCGKPDSHDFEITNVSGMKIKTLIYLQRSDGAWTKEADGTFDNGINPGGKAGNYVCSGTGQYKVAAMRQSDFVANSCHYPEYGKW